MSEVISPAESDDFVILLGDFNAVGMRKDVCEFMDGLGTDIGMITGVGFRSWRMYIEWL